MHTLLLVSAAADVADVEAARGVLSSAGMVELVEVSSPAGVDETLDRLAGRRLVVAGGDASLHLVLRRLWARGELAATPVGLLPLGAGADLAVHLGLPTDPAAAAEIAVAGRLRRLDLLRSDGGGGIAVNAVRIGRPGRAAGGLRRLLRPPGWPLHVNVDDQLLADGRTPVLTVVIGNGSTIGGRRMLPHADPGDGALDVLVLGPSGRALAGTAGQPWRLVRSCRGRAATVSPPPGVTVPIEVDGEVATLTGRRSWWVEPAAWSAVVPD